MRISAVLACHNEEKFIQAWLEETSAYADEILIAVHAPTDATADLIAAFKPHSPVPIHCEWFPALTVARFGFSLMKNEMIARACGDWITSIDTDEEIGLTREELLGEIERAVSAGKSLISLRWAEHPRPAERPAEWDMRHRHALRRLHLPFVPAICKCKIFQNDAGFWWDGWIHEVVTRSGVELGPWCFESEACLHHYAYLNESVPACKRLLYDYLICRIRDCSFLRGATDRWWYEEGFVGNESAIRAAAAEFVAGQNEWFPEVPCRTI